MRNIITTRALLGTALACACVVAPRCVTAGVNAWTPIGPDGGIVHDVEFSQTNPGTFYAVGRAGVYRSTVAGDSFELLKDDFDQSPFDLAVDPTQSDRVLVAADGLYVGAGADWGLAQWSSPDPGVKVWVSRDGAAAYFAAGKRIFRSQDLGLTWQERGTIPGTSPSSLVHALQTDPTNANVVYVDVFGFGLFASSDGAATWHSLGSGEPAIAYTINFVVAPSNPLRLLAATTTGLYISDDGGLTWNSTTLTAYIQDVDVDPFDPRVIYVAGSDFRKSTDGGVTWTVLPVDQPYGFFHLAIDPTQPSRLAAFGGEGVSLSLDSGATWAKRIAGFKGTDTSAFSGLASSRRNYFGVDGRGRVYYVEPGQSVARSVNNDPLALLAPAPLIHVRVLALPGAADTLYVVMNNEVLAKSGDAGLHWSELSFPGSSIDVLAGSPLEPRTLYAGGVPGKVYKSVDAGASWIASSAGLPDDLRVEVIAIASMPSTLYASGTVPSNAPGSSEWGIYRSADGGITWSAASARQPNRIASLTVDPNDPLVVYAGFGNELHKTTDGGASWTRLSRGAFPLCCLFGAVVFDPTDPDVFYAQHRGVWRTVDAGASWEEVAAPNRAASVARGALALDPANASRLLAGWTGLGVSELTITPDLMLSLTAPTALTASVPASYTFALHNAGPFDATDVRVTAQLPQGATAPSMSGTGGACTLAATTASCSFGVLRSGATTPIVLGFVPAAGSVVVSASATGGQPDPLAANNTVTSTLVANAPAPPASSGGGGSMSPTALALLVVLSLWNTFRNRSRKRMTLLQFSQVGLSSSAVTRRPADLARKTRRTARPRG